jgi:hypothetical protein
LQVIKWSKAIHTSVVFKSKVKEVVNPDWGKELKKGSFMGTYHLFWLHQVARTPETTITWSSIEDLEMMLYNQLQQKLALEEVNK